MNCLAEFLSGVCFASFGAAGFFFLKFWTASHDRFFLYFAFGCWILAAERPVLLAIREIAGARNSNLAEANSWVYLMRLLAFLLIMIAIIDKNKRSSIK